MGQSPEELKKDIEQTRAEMSRDVDAISDKVSPSRIVQRRVDRTKSTIGGLRERVMGSTSSYGNSLGERASSAASGVSDAVTGAPDMAKERTQGNPLAMGLLAFAAGMVAASLLPVSSVETQAAGALEDKAREPLQENLKEMAGQLKDDLQDSAQDAVESIKDRATEGAQSVADQGQDSAGNVRSEAASATGQVRENMSSSST
jgi:hypothetical protein